MSRHWLWILALGVLAVAPARATSQKALLLFGGENHKVFLGCLNCVSTSSSSVCNEYGKYGSQYQSGSIWNQFGTYGSEFNSFSPWNQFTQQAPIIVDDEGKSYGYFTRNEFKADRTRIGWALKVLDYQEKSGDLDKTREYLCKE